jgi:biotin transport system permease protein
MASHSPIHQLDPRSKLIAAMALSIISLHGDPITLTAISVAMAALPFLSHASFHHIFQTVKPTLPFVFILFIFQVLFPADNGTAPILSFGPIHITTQGFVIALAMMWRLILLLLSGVFLSITTPPPDLTQGIERLLRPLAIIGISSQDIALMVTIALRFIPTIALEIDTIKAAHTARGVTMSEGGITSRLKATVTLVVPLCLAVFRRCDDLVVAMESRGYDGGIRTGLRVLKLCVIDWVVMGTSTGAVVIVFVL